MAIEAATAVASQAFKIDRVILFINNVAEPNRARGRLKQKAAKENSLSIHRYIQSPDSPQNPLPIINRRISTFFIVCAAIGAKAITKHHTAFVLHSGNAHKNFVAYCLNVPFGIDQQLRAISDLDTSTP